MIDLIAVSEAYREWLAWLCLCGLFLLSSVLVLWWLVNAVSGPVLRLWWLLRGGRETWFPLDLGDFVFPLGTNRIQRLRVISGGTVETFGPDAVSISAAREYASLVPGVSRFGWADSGDGAARLLRWESVFAGRDQTGEYDAEILLFANGDFTTRSNDVETVCRRVNPDDWDGDGLANEKDVNPLAYDGDFFGVPNALPTNANLDAYYTLDVAAVGALDFATIRVTCDGPSDLGDHVVIARTNQVCHVPLLAGATYAVESDLPISYSAVSSEHAHIVTELRPRELPFLRDGYGQDDEWVAANFTNATVPFIANAEYSAIDDVPQTKGGTPSPDPEGQTHAWSVDGGRYAISSQTESALGRVLWLPLFYGSPDVAHVGPGGGRRACTRERPGGSQASWIRDSDHSHRRPGRGEPQQLDRDGKRRESFIHTSLSRRQDRAAGRRHRRIRPMTQIVGTRQSYPSGASRHLPCLRGGVGNSKIE